MSGKFKTGSCGNRADHCRFRLSGQVDTHALSIKAKAASRRNKVMNQNNRIFDGLGRVINEAAGVADGVRREVETVVKSQANRFVSDMDLVKREDFDALRELVQVQGEEIDALRKELAALKGAADTI